ncbi:hypothetical protein C7M84_008141 [Penaeus vannamei]|uniref:Uncharacterized protein n=1 Tax=Penaeus vannamei TaxID=6689 RepID=A0A3R7M5J6_PENVA|nr:hypothetical protein C7M84_008141 [Penaeus vannamei]
MCAQLQRQRGVSEEGRGLRNMHRESNRRERMVQTIINCAQQLDIKTLPSFDSSQDPSESSYMRFRVWMRAHPEDKRRLFACAHQGLFTPDGHAEPHGAGRRVLAVLETRSANFEPPSSTTSKHARRTR